MIRIVVTSWKVPYEWEEQVRKSLGDDYLIDWTYDESTLTQDERRGATRNQWDAIQRAADDDIIVTIGGDDTVEPGAIGRIAKLYEDPECWLTYGSCRNSDGSPSHSHPQVHDDVRNHPFVWMPLTFRAWLAKKIRPEDLQIADWWLWSSGDVALALPMVEMAGRERCRFIKDEWYVRRIHEGNDHARSRRLQDFCNFMARSKPKYSKLASRADVPERTEHILNEDLLFKADSQNSFMLRRNLTPPSPAAPVEAQPREPDKWMSIPMGDHQLFITSEPTDTAKDKIRAMIKAAPDAIIALSNPSDAAKDECKRDGIPFYTSADGISTMGYVMPRTLSAQFIAWSESVLPDVRNPVALFAMATGRPLWHPIGEPPYETTRPIPHIGRINNFHWQLITKLRRALPLRAYAVERDRP